MIAVADGQCMMIVEQGRVVELCAEPGEFTYDASSEPSVFSGSLSAGIKNTFAQIGKRFTYGGDAGKVGAVGKIQPLQDLAADPLLLETALHSLVAPVRDAEEKYVQLLCGLVRRGSGAVQLTPDVCWTAANGILYCRSVLKMQPEAIPAPHQLLKTGVYCLPGGYELEIQQLNYEVFLKNPSFLKKDYTYCADYAKINKNIFVRTRQPGDTFRPAGRHVGKTLKKYLNEAKVPVAERTLMPLLACGSQVLWLWGAGFADGLSPDDGTKQILLIRQSRQPAAPEQEQDHNIGGTDHA